MSNARVFQGKNTKQICGVTGAAAAPEQWYLEPSDYEGDVLWSAPFDRCEQATAAAKRAGLKVTEINGVRAINYVPGGGGLPNS